MWSHVCPWAGDAGDDDRCWINILEKASSYTVSSGDLNYVKILCSQHKKTGGSSVQDISQILIFTYTGSWECIADSTLYRLLGVLCRLPPSFGEVSLLSMTQHESHPTIFFQLIAWRCGAKPFGMLFWSTRKYWHARRSNTPKSAVVRIQQNCHLLTAMAYYTAESNSLSGGRSGR
jgi:hypothetical protein